MLAACSTLPDKALAAISQYGLGIKFAVGLPVVFQTPRPHSSSHIALAIMSRPSAGASDVEYERLVAQLSMNPYVVDSVISSHVEHPPPSISTQPQYVISWSWS